MMYTRDNPKFITKPEEINELKLRDYFKFKCVKCGNYQVKQVNSPSKLLTHKCMLCTYCLTHVDHYTKDNPKFINSFDELKSLHKNDSFMFKCRKCNGLYTVSRFRKYRIKSYKNMLCLSCFRREFRIRHPEIVTKSMETIRKNHGGLHNMQTKESRELMRLRNSSNPEVIDTLQKYRKMYPEKCQSKRIIYKNMSFDSIPELYVYLYCVYHWIPIIRNHTIYFEYEDNENNIHRVYPDFIINCQLVEIKGAHFFRQDGTMYLPYRKPEWSDEEYNYMCDLYEHKRQCLINNNVLILKNTDPWIKNCINWVKNIINIKDYMKSNPNNLCYGYNPYNYNKELEYQKPIGIGLTPFDIKS